MSEKNCTPPTETSQSVLSMFMTRKLSNTYSNRRAQTECEKATETILAAKNELAPPPRRKGKSSLEAGLDLKNAEVRKRFVQTYLSGKAAK